MKAVRLVAAGWPLEMQEVPVPETGPRDALVRVKAAGICRSDVHYRAGVSPAGPLPLTLGHEVAGVVEEIGSDAAGVRPGDRVCIHYLATCGECEYCLQGREQFCRSGKMIGKHRDGGFAEFLAVPARCLFRIPDSLPFPQAAILMCSSATSFHALRKGRLQAGDTVAVFGAGGLGMSAIQIARALGALDVYAVDIEPGKLQRAASLGAHPVNARETDPVAEILRRTGGRGVDVSLELIGLPLTMQQAFRCLAIFGRAVIAGITQEGFEVVPYNELVNKEAEIIGCSDHLASELPLLIEMDRRGVLELSGVITNTVPLDAAAINAALDRLEQFGGDTRTVVEVNG